MPSMRAALLGTLGATLLLWATTLKTSARPPALKETDELHVSSLVPAVQNHFRHLVLQAYSLNPEARVVSSRRTVAEQNRLYRQGREDAGSIVTNARGCQSWHVLGRAVDIQGLSRSQYQQLGAWWAERGGKWGGNFRSFEDLPHFEFHPDMTIEQACPDPDAALF